MPKPQRRVPRSNGIIVAPQPEASNAGAEVLANGGNAMDAILAAALVQGVVDPLMCGVGGFGIMHIYDSKTKRQDVYVGLGACPKESTATMWQDRYIGETVDGFGYIVRDFVNESGATSVSTPIILDVFRKAHEKYGTWSWNDLFQPAVEVATNGWLIRPHVYTVITQNERKYGRLNYSEKLGLTEGGRKLYLDAQGDAKKPGSLIQNLDMARTLALIGREGADVFFKGSLGEHITTEIRKDGGLVSMADLADAVAELVDPISVNYRGRRFSTVPAPGGGVYVAQALKVLERFDLTSMKHNSPEYIALLAEVMKLSTRDKEARIADPRFVKDPTEELLSDAYADQCAAIIRSGEKVLTNRSGHLDSKHTTHISCVDKDGLVIALTHTLGNPSGYVVKDTGMMMNGAMSTFDPRPGSPQSIEPGKRRLTPMCPSIVFDNDKPVLTLGAPGASWIGPAVLQVTLNVLDWGMGIQEAISAARIVATSNMVDVSNRISTKTECALNRMGYETRRSHYTYAFAGVHGITMWPEDGLEGGADPQRDGMAVGVP